MLNKAKSILCTASIVAGAFASMPSTADAGVGRQRTDFGRLARLLDYDAVSESLAERRMGRSLRGTKCWAFQPRFGMPSFVTLQFKRMRDGQSLVTGQVVRGDGKKPDRVLQISGSAGYHKFTGDDNTEIARYLLDLTYSFSKTGTSPDAAFAEAFFHLRGHYSVRLSPESLDGVFAGNDFILRWQDTLTGPSRTFSSNPGVEGGGGDGVTANYMGGIECEGGSCGTILPINNAGSWELIGNDPYECARAQSLLGTETAE